MTASCPGFANYEVLADGQVLVNGALPTASSNQEQEMASVWETYGCAVATAARKHGVPAPWLMGVMMAESRGNPNACSPCSICRKELCASGAGLQCCAFGLMQFTAQTAEAYGLNATTMIQSPALAIDAGARLLADLMDRHGFDLPRMAASYNSGGARCGKDQTTFGWVTNGDYPMTVVRYANSAFELSQPVCAGSVFTGVVFAVVGLGLAYRIYTGKL